MNRAMVAKRRRERGIILLFMNIEELNHEMEDARFSADQRKPRPDWALGLPIRGTLTELSQLKEEHDSAWMGYFCDEM
jgi:hypothetical protein